MNLKTRITSAGPPSCNIHINIMNGTLLKLSYYCAILSFIYWFVIKPSIKLHPIASFPELHEAGPTGTYLIHPETRLPYKPAYFTLTDRGTTVFYNLLTNETIGDSYAYTGVLFKQKAFAKIRLSHVPFGRVSLFEYTRNKQNAYNVSNPLVQMIFKHKRNNWWEHLSQDWEKVVMDYARTI